MIRFAPGGSLLAVRTLATRGKKASAPGPAAPAGLLTAAAAGLATLAAVATFAPLAACTKADPHPPVLDSHPAVPTTGGGGGGGGDGGVASGDGGAGGIVLAPLAWPALGVALDPSLVYFTIGGAASPDVDAGPFAPGSIARVPKTGGAPEALVTGGAQPTDVLVANDRLVWLDGNAVYSVDLGTPGATVATLVSGLDHPSGIASDGTFVYVASRSAATGVDVSRAPIDGAAVATNVTTFVGAVSPARLAVSQGEVFVVVVAPGGGALLRVAAAGGTAESIWDTPSGVPTDVAVASGRAWVTIDDDAQRASLVAVPTAASAPVTVAGQLDHATRVAADDADVYFLEGDDLARVPATATAGTEPTIVASALGGATALVVGDAVYVATSARGVVRVAK